MRHQGVTVVILLLSKFAHAFEKAEAQTLSPIKEVPTSDFVHVNEKELLFTQDVLFKFNLSRSGVPPKVTKDSLAMELRNNIFDTTTNILTVDENNAGDLITLVQRNLGVKINKGSAAGFTGFTFSPVLNDLGCFFTPKLSCSKLANFRTITGVCNNLAHPYWGSASISMRRYVAPQYADGFGEPRGTRNSSFNHCDTPVCFGECECMSDPKRLLPNPRLVSVTFHPEGCGAESNTTHMFTQFGQFLDHDITLTPESEEASQCCEGEDEHCSEMDDPNNLSECFPIKIPSSCGIPGTQSVDCTPVGPASPYGGGPLDFNTEHCLHFARSVPFCKEAHCAREQMNGITAFIDASNVYGSSYKDAWALRDGDFLKESANQLLPLDPLLNEEQAGDTRAREMPGLASLHTIFLREHNRITNFFSSTDPQRFEKVRRIVIAEMQSIVFNEYLPILIGIEKLKECELSPVETAIYDPHLDPSIRNAFATAAFRFGHSMIQDMIKMFSSDLSTQLSSYELHDNYFDLTNYRLNAGSGMEQIIAGLLIQPSKDMDRFAINDATDFLFAHLDPNCIGSDLLARNIQRGRDHGLPGYNEFREYCKMERACSWDTAPEEIDLSTWKRLSKMYSTPADIDLFVAGLAEKPYAGGIVGRTFNCLIAEQFKRLKFGDRFFFNLKGNPNPFTPLQIDNLLNRRLGDIICDNTNLERMRDNVFLGDSNFFSCTEANQLNLKLFL